MLQRIIASFPIWIITFIILSCSSRMSYSLLQTSGSRRRIHRPFLYSLSRDDLSNLMSGVLSRAERTLSNKSNLTVDDPEDVSNSNVVDVVFSKTREALVSKVIAPTPTATAPAPNVLPRQTDIELNYLENPTIASTALVC
jgi:hypothetical protein